MNKYVAMARYADVISAENQREFREWALSTQVVNLSFVDHAKDLLKKLTVLGRMQIALPGMALEVLSYELLPLTFVDDLAYGEFRWYVSRRFEHTPREVRRSFQAISNKQLRKIYEHIRALHATVAKNPEAYPGWAAIRGETAIPLAKKVKTIKSWLGEGGVVWTTK
jgi:hypothetical protein